MFIDTFFEEATIKEDDYPLPSPNTVAKDVNKEWSWTETNVQSMSVSNPIIML